MDPALQKVIDDIAKLTKSANLPPQHMSSDVQALAIVMKSMSTAINDTVAIIIDMNKQMLALHQQVLDLTLRLGILEIATGINTKEIKR